ncbi:thiamine pyrophosphate-dependent enzyme [Acetohalobium arabaticum]|uniref:2-oxoglutarate ferredoxin oxidoreductase, beta subunit n=1 Tax=Acetohalobium arabaticum (strain ATCC 49924 / DSM 5501 / Z-7288) TaxID=574087 RepID=D9QUU2_ACEAZ|nr:thiamine pyrophosphate-dependent enzyme [Acetohalobium arabaticum]ADL12001.1 2-oxoglutarate ferredoxin oxidoreductase, beta subunit [Acetohalobium arabaticum DSM 5501]
MEYTGEEFLKSEDLPLFWCAGCGHGILLGSIVRALEESGLSRENTVVVTGIGCWGKADDYLTTHAFHGTHGRAIGVATGVKFANPDLNVIALVGDGDGVTIGGNHLIHAARRNTDITVIMSNNLNYGMTGGQYSGSTPNEAITSTSPYGHVEDQFDISELVKESGAGYVAKETVAKPLKLQKYISKALQKDAGFRFVEALSVCPTHFGKNNKLGGAVEMINHLDSNTVKLKAAQEMNSEELEDKYVIGEYADRDVDGYIKRYQEVQKNAANA